MRENKRSGVVVVQRGRAPGARPARGDPAHTPHHASLPFVAPAAAGGLVLHGVKGRPWLGMLAFAVLVVVLPVLLAPALGTGAFSDLAEWVNDPQW
ncbi:hypothetical protein SFC79_18245 [Nocardioides sp. S-58]|uniref:Uncharacterized protein n=1 Tax=Nocardioides renjunii TaxID=3095075 RepID=A0ABU5KFH7_9ACTN|nr:hypothetical protein [Nocardioides sp. S-58]MDZ5663722.1 hypothetical protein [Nocardioides sp. S-58]